MGTTASTGSLGAASKSWIDWIECLTVVVEGELPSNRRRICLERTVQASRLSCLPGAVLIPAGPLERSLPVLSPGVAARSFLRRPPPVPFSATPYLEYYS